MYNKTVMEWISDTKNDALQVSLDKKYEILATVVFSVAITRGKKFWLDLLHLAIFLEAVYIIFFGKMYLENTTVGVLDDLHLSLFKGYGLVALLFCFRYFLLNKSTDSTSKSSQLVGLLIFLSCIALAQGYLVTHPSTSKFVCAMNDKMLVTFLYFSVLFTLGTLIHTVRLKDWGGFNEIPGHANLHLRLDFVMLLVMGVLIYSLPQWTLKMMSAVEKVDTVHVLSARSIGASLIAMAYMSARSANFLKPSEKDAVMVSHWLYYVLFCCMGWCGMLFKWSELSWKRIGLHAIHDLVIIANSTGALGFDITILKRVIIPRFQAIPQDMRNLLKTKTL